MTHRSAAPSSPLGEIVNPILRGFAPDPSVCRVGDTVHVATSTFEWYPGVQIHASEDLVNWRLVARPLARAAQLDLRGNPDSGGVWAPCLSHADGRFWLIYTDVKRLDGSYKDAHNYLVTADDVAGEWSDPVRLNSSGFDPSLFHDDDGRKWLLNMLWDHTNGRGSPSSLPHPAFAGIALQEYDVAAGRLVGPIRNVFAGSARGLTEAPHVFKRDGWYFLTTAEGGTSYEHAITVARARTLEGPYELHPDTHLIDTRDAPDHPLQRCGHGQYLELADGSAWFTYLCTRPLPGTRRSPMGRETGLARCRWGDDGWPYLDSAAGGTVPDVRVRASGAQDDAGRGTGVAPVPETAAAAGDARGEASPISRVERTEFASDALPLDFQWPRSPAPERLFSLAARPGHLRLFGRESIGSWFEQSLVARRQREWRYRADTRLECAPEDVQQAAGLVTYFNRTQFHYLAVTGAPLVPTPPAGRTLDPTAAASAPGGRRLTILSCASWPEGELVHPLESDVALPAEGPVWLGVDVDGAEQRFRYSLDGRDWVPVGPVLDATVLADEGVRGEHSCFTGNFVGMAAQDTSGRGWPADFAGFELESFAAGGHHP